MRTSMPDAQVGIGLPDFPRYRALLAETEASLERVGVEVFLVVESGAVQRVAPYGS
jgi:hypothetical protein